MSTLDTVIAQLTKVRDKARAKLGQSDLDLTEAVDALIAGYGTGGGAVSTHEVRYAINDNDTHTREIVWTPYNMVISEAEFDCYLQGGSIYVNKYSCNGDGTHNWHWICECGRDVVYRENISCSDEDGDGVCDACGGAVT